MLTKEKYKRDLIRMWDSVRSTRKGEKNCGGISCADCPFKGKICGEDTAAIFNAHEAIEIIENWGKENPAKTNADKFKEMFGIEPPIIQSCINFEGKCGDCKYSDGGECDADNRFWNAEYNPSKEGEE